MERRHFEERKRVEEDEHKRASGLVGWRRNRRMPLPDHYI
jgi:hypothetical protein